MTLIKKRLEMPETWTMTMMIIRMVSRLMMTSTHLILIYTQSKDFEVGSTQDSSLSATSKSGLAIDRPWIKT